VLNTIVADSLDFIATQLEKATGGDVGKLGPAVQSLLQQIVLEHGAVIYNGDNYTAEWHAEAEKRGLPNLKTTVEALPCITDPDAIEMFKKYNVLSKRELESRRDIYLEQYCKTISTESRLCIEIAKTMIFPAATRYQGELAQIAANLKTLGKTIETPYLDKVTSLIQGLQQAIARLEQVSNHQGGHGLLAEAKHFCHDVVPAMAEVRQYVDELEGIVADDLWPLPTYQEMLFIK